MRAYLIQSSCIYKIVPLSLTSSSLADVRLTDSLAWLGLLVGGLLLQLQLFPLPNDSTGAEISLLSHSLSSRLHILFRVAVVTQRAFTLILSIHLVLLVLIYSVL